MKLQLWDELPIRNKVEMAEEVGRIIGYLHAGQRVEADSLIDELKLRSLYLDEQIQGDVLQFAEQVYFQYDYDPWHKVTPEVEEAADKLIEDLGFAPPKEE